MLSGEATESLDGRSQLESLVRRSHCLKVWTKKQSGGSVVVCRE